MSRSLEEIARMLGNEGHGAASYHLAGRKICRQLRGLIKVTRIEPAPPPAPQGG